MANTRAKTQGRLFLYSREHERNMHLWWRPEYEDYKNANFQTVNLKCFILLGIISLFYVT